MSFLSRLFAKSDPRDALRPLYDRVVAEAREPAWYAQAGVPDTLDGRFEMVALVLSLVLHRLEDDQARSHDSVLLTEVFVEDMDAQIRQIGFGDLVVGKQVGKIMSALGGRLGTYADEDPDRLRAALDRNLYRDAPPSMAERDHALGRMLALRARLAATDAAALAGGEAWADAGAAA